MSMSLKKFYQETVVPQLKQELNCSNVMDIPKIVKVVVNMGVKDALNDRKAMDQAAKDLTMIAGQKAIVTKSRKSIAGFKIREGWPIGCCVTLRNERMYQFLERLLFIALPRVRDFRGLNHKSFDGQGNYSMGVKEQLIFPEINYDKIDTIRGLDITIVTSARTDEEGKALLYALKFPLKQDHKGRGN